MSQDWYKNAKSQGSNFEFYKRHLLVAEEILYSDIPLESIVVEFVNADKKVANFIASEQKTGFFKYERFTNSLRVGDVLSVRFDGNGTEGHYRVLTLEKSNDNNFRDQYIKSIRIGEGKPFGFLQDAFVHPSLIKKYRLQNKQSIEAKVMKSFNPDKKVWGWKVFEIDLTK